MAQVTSSEIILDNNKIGYQAGDQISGQLEFGLIGDLMRSDVKIHLVGMAEVKWIEKPNTKYHRDAFICHNTKRFIDLKPENSDEDNEIRLGSGDHVIPFKFNLPSSNVRGIPSSFESSLGFVAFYIEAVIKDEHKIKSKIFVDMPFQENLHLSVGASAVKELGLLNLASGKLEFNANLTKKGFIPGEIIELHITVDNSSTADVTPRATLYQTQIYMCGERHKTLELDLTEAIVGKKVEQQSNYRGTIFVPIPNAASLSIKTTLLTIKYFIHLTLDIPNAIDLHLNLPIVITTQQALNNK